MSPKVQLNGLLDRFTPEVAANVAIRALMAEALQRADKPFHSAGPSRIVIKSISAKQPPRRPKA